MFRFPAFLALLVVVSPVTGSAAAAVSSDAPEAAAASAGPGVASQQKWIYEHSLGVGYHSLYLKTKSGDGYGLNGPSVAYSLFIGREWGLMLRAEGHLPQLGDMHGPSGDFAGALGDFYNQQRFGVDLAALVARRLSLGHRLTLTAGLGVHFQGFGLSGALYSPVEDLSLGAGVLGKLEYFINQWFAVSVQLAAGFDFIDLVAHANPAQLVVPLSGTIALSLPLLSGAPEPP